MDVKTKRSTDEHDRFFSLTFPESDDILGARLELWPDVAPVPPGDDH